MKPSLKQIFCLTLKLLQKVLWSGARRKIIVLCAVGVMYLLARRERLRRVEVLHGRSVENLKILQVLEKCIKEYSPTLY